MNHCFSYAVLKLAPSYVRGEQLNVAAVVFLRDQIDIRVTRRLDKVRAISAALDLEALRDSILALREIDNDLQKQGITEPRDRASFLGDLGLLQFSPIANFVAPTSAIYEAALNNIMRSMIDPEAALKTDAKKKRSKVLSLVRAALKQERILGSLGDDLSSHRVIPSYTLAEGLVADFVLKNGAVHVVETVDASSDDVSARKVISDVAVSALVLEQARIKFGESNTKGRIIYEASSAIESIAMPSLMAAQHQGAELINWQSADDRRKFVTHISTLAQADASPPRRTDFFLATTQTRQKLN